jgi:hypothetical protein
MSDDASKFKPFSAKGREFFEDGIWILVVVGGAEYYVKVDKDNLKAAFEGKSFDAHMPMAIQLQQPPIFMPKLYGTIDAFRIHGGSFSTTALVHPELSAALDKQLQHGLSIIDVVTEGDAPPPPKPGEKVKLHLT